MWVLTTDGFLSGVQEKRRGKHYGQIVVRARERSALEALREVAPALSEIVIETQRDYRYRAWLDREDWAQALAAMARAVTYDNFKSEVARKQGYSRYEKALHKVWDVLGTLQPTGPYGWGGKGYPAVPKGEPRKTASARKLW